MKKLHLRVKTLLWAIVVPVLMVAVVTACKKDEDKTPTASKTALVAKLAAANALYTGAVEGTAVGKYEAGSKAVLKTAIDAATAVNNDAAALQTAVDNAVVNLGKAMDTFLTKQVQQIAPDKLVAFFKFDGNPADSSGKGNNGTLKTGSALWGAGMPVLTKDRFGVDNKAYHFDKGGNVEVPYNPVLNPAKEISISLWAKLTTKSKASNYMVALNRWNGYKFQIQDAPKAFFTIKTDQGIWDKDDESAVLDTNKWYHLAVTYKSGEMNFYVEGTLVKSWTDKTGDPVTVKNTINLTIGQDLPTSLYNSSEANDADGNNFNGPWGGYFTGDLDEVRIYNIALSRTQVTSIYNAEKP